MDGKNNLENLSQTELGQYLISAFQRVILHHGFWFNEVQHQLGLEEALKAEREVASRYFPVALKHFSNALGIELGEGSLPRPLLNMPKEKLIGLIDAMAVSWLADDGIWFQAVEKSHGMDTSKRCNDTCWTRFSPLEASILKSFLHIPQQGGLEGLAKALDFRLYARINKHIIEREANVLVFKVATCRVQYARKSKGLDDYPCKSAGLAEYEAFARTVDARFKTQCIACPPDKHPDEWACAWRFTLAEA